MPTIIKEPYFLRQMKQDNEPFCDECDMFESKNAECSSKDDQWFMFIKIFTFACTILMVVGIGGYVIKQSMYKKTGQPIVIYPPTEPLKITPDVEIVKDEIEDYPRIQPTSPVTKRKKRNNIYDKVIKKQQKMSQTPSSEKQISVLRTPSYYIGLGIF